MKSILLGVVAAISLSTAPCSLVHAQTRVTMATADATRMLAAGESATRAVTELRRVHQVDINDAVTAMTGGGYPATAIASAVRTSFSVTATPIYLAFKAAGYANNTLATTLPQAGITLDCWDPQGMPVPCGGFGGQFDTAPLGQVTYAPTKSGFVDSVLSIMANALPPLDVRIGSTVLQQISYSAAKIQVRLPSSPTNGPLTLRRKSDNVEAKLENMYQVTKPVVTFSWPAVVNGAMVGATLDARAWMSGARLSGCTVTGAQATAPAGSFSSTATFQGHISNEIKKAGGSTNFAAAVENGIRLAWTEWAASVSVAGLPWYPAFAAWTQESAPPTGNVPTPLGATTSMALVVMAPNSIAVRIETLAFGTNAVPPDAKSAIQQIASQFTTRFTAMLASNLVVNVNGSGTVPVVGSGSALVGPVKGTCAGSQVLGSNPLF